MLKSTFKRGLKKKHTKILGNGTLSMTIASRYHCSFFLYESAFSFTVIADFLSNLDYEDLDVDCIEKLNQR